MKTTPEPWIAPEIVAVAIDETEHWNLSKFDTTHLLRIECVYVYDRTERTYCCEATPSRCLFPVLQRPIFREGVELDEATLEAWNEAMIENMESDPHYRHARSIDAEPVLATYEPKGGWEPGTSSQDAIDEAIEYFLANHP